MDLIRLLADPGLVVKFQRVCGVEYDKPITCDQQTQTRRESSDSNNSPKDEYSISPVQPDNPLQDDPKGTVQNGVIDCSIKETTDDSKCQAKRLTDPDVMLRERNNNCNNILTSIHVSSANDQNQAPNCKTHKFALNQTNGYHIIEPTGNGHRQSSISECNGDSVAPRFSNDISDNTDGSCPGDPLTTPAVRIKYKSLLYLARFGAFLGNELFYLTFFPFIIWNLDALIVRQVSMLWCVVMYLGQATKDYLRWPRPPCPPVVRLEIHYSREYSMPSTHAMAGTAIPLYLAYLAVERYQVPVFVAGALALLWFSVTCWSRIYLGVHSVLDLLAGCVYALMIFFTFLGYVESYDLYQQTHPFGAPVLLFTALTLCTILYPTHYKNSSKADAVQIVAAYAGLGIGSWMGYQLGYMRESDISQPYSIAVPTLSWAFMALLRFITGVAVLGLLHTVTRWWTIRFYSYIYGLDEPDKTYPGVMTAYKFTTYAVVGAGAALFAPLLHLHLGIHRPALFNEVL